MRIFLKLAIVVVLASLVPARAAADQPATTAPAAPAPAAPDAALTARFSGFLSDVLAGRVPATGMSDQMKAALTPDMLAQVDAAFKPLGAFQKLQYVREDAAQGYDRYHYIAVFANGTLPLIFVTDSNGNIAGFFKDQSQ
jgi:hypothetical protein